MNPYSYLQVKLPAWGLVILGLIPVIIEHLMQVDIIPEQYHAALLLVVIPLLREIGKKIPQPELHNIQSFVAVNAGHSNTDPGAVSDGYKEADIVVAFRQALAYKLRMLGHEVKTDGTGLENLPLSAAIKSSKGSDLAVEIHTNAFSSSKATGVETISNLNKKVLSQNISAAIANVFELPLRGDKGWIDQSKSARGSLGFINQADGLIIELGFITNPKDRQMILERYWLAADAVANVIHKYLNNQ